MVDHDLGEQVQDECDIAFTEENEKGDEELEDGEI